MNQINKIVKTLMSKPIDYEDARKAITNAFEIGRDEERDDIWKWIGENSWTQDSPTGEVRVIDVDELADFWRKNDRLKII